MDERWILIDRDTGLHVGWYFWLRLLDEVGRSDRYGSSFGLALLDARPVQGSRKGALEQLSRLSGAIRGTDLAGLIGPARAGIILTQQEPDASELGLKRILGLFQPASTPTLWDAELLCYPRDAAAVTHLITLRNPERVSA